MDTGRHAAQFLDELRERPLEALQRAARWFGEGPAKLVCDAVREAVDTTLDPVIRMAIEDLALLESAVPGPLVEALAAAAIADATPVGTTSLRVSEVMQWLERTGFVNRGEIRATAFRCAAVAREYLCSDLRMGRERANRLRRLASIVETWIEDAIEGRAAPDSLGLLGPFIVSLTEVVPWEHVARLAIRVSEVLHEAGRLHDAALVLREIASRRGLSSRSASRPTVEALVSINLASIHGDLGQTSEGVSLVQGVIAALSGVGTRPRALLGEANSVLAMLLLAQCRAAEALEAIDAAISCGHPTVALCAAFRSNRALILTDLRRHPEAIQALHDAIQLEILAFGADSHPVAVSRYNLAYVLADAGSLDAAREEVAAALAVLGNGPDWEYDFGIANVVAAELEDRDGSSAQAAIHRQCARDSFLKLGWAAEHADRVVGP